MKEGGECSNDPPLWSEEWLMTKEKDNKNKITAIFCHVSTENVSKSVRK